MNSHITLARGSTHVVFAFPAVPMFSVRASNPFQALAACPEMEHLGRVYEVGYVHPSRLMYHRGYVVQYPFRLWDMFRLPDSRYLNGFYLHVIEQAEAGHIFMYNIGDEYNLAYLSQEFYPLEPEYSFDLQFLLSEVCR